MNRLARSDYNSRARCRMAIRAGGGAVSGGLSAGLVNPEDASTGAVIGGLALALFGRWCCRSCCAQLVGGKS